MLKVSDRLALFFFNITGVFNFKYENNVLKVSKAVMVWNTVATPLSTMFFYFLMSSSFLQDFVFDKEIISFDQISRFSRGLIIFASFLIQCASIGSCFSQLWNRNYVLKFLNEINELHSLLDDDLKEVFQKHATRNILIASFLCTTGILVQFSIFRITAVTFFISFVLCLSYLATLGFLSSIKTFELFLNTLMQEFDMTLEKMLESPEFDFEKCQRLAIIHQNLYQLSVQFTKDFGFPLTSITCYYIVITSMDVKRFLIL